MAEVISFLIASENKVWHIQQNLNINQNICKILAHESMKQWAQVVCLGFD